MDTKISPDMRILLSLLVLAIIGGFLGTKLSSGARPGEGNSYTATALDALRTPSPKITLGFVGDIMTDRSVRIHVNKYLGGDYNKLFEHANFLKEPDIMFANLEGPVSDKGRNVGSIYSFRMDPATIPALKRAGFDVLSFNNNHVGDWGGSAFEDTIKRLRSAGILVCGAGINRTEAETPAVIVQDGVRVGFLCFTDVGPNSMAATDTRSGILLASDPRFDSIVSAAAGSVDALIVSFHWGTEYEKMHSARQEELAKRAIDDGAVMIEGEHPHVAEDISSYNGTPILYSLGNFIFDQYFSDETMHGLFVTADLQDKKITNVVPHVTVLDKDSVVSLEQ